ncbi:phage portal protein [Macrococcus bovicus]|uniref:Phage portal protein n=1 Tax=Macrococcus bovicus TaxID=69968 RepID=A0A4R6C3T4_9STAP|nr:phage portal protein [Macrococcus bovicus]TDM15706.1 phage portal protein [Macrococcus bovicus]
MGILDIFALRARSEEASYILDLDLVQDLSARSYLKRMALQTSIEYLARAIAQTRFIVKGTNKAEQDALTYKLNVRPNTDQSAANFWHEVMTKLIYDGEVLIIQTDTKDLVVATDFQRDEMALYDDTFSDVYVKDYKYERVFKMSDVIYMKYANQKLERFVDGLFADYGEMFGRMIDRHLLNNQIRGTVSMPIKGSTYTADQIARLNEFVKRLYNSFDKPVAIVPQAAGIEYKDIPFGGSNQEFKELNELKKSVTEDVARMIGIPPVLISGEMADLENAMTSFNKYCLGYFLKLINDEMNAKFFEPDEYLSGAKIKMIGINKKDPLELATAVDKLRASGTFTGNQIREMLGEEAVDNVELDKYVITKNYQSVETVALEGGDNK